MIAERKHADTASTHDLLSSLIDANEKDGTGLTESDLMGKPHSYSSRQMPTLILKEISSSSFWRVMRYAWPISIALSEFGGAFNRLLLIHLDSRLHYLHFIRTNKKNCMNTLYLFFLKGPYQ